MSETMDGVLLSDGFVRAVLEENERLRSEIRFVREDKSKQIEALWKEKRDLLIDICLMVEQAGGDIFVKLDNEYHPKRRLTVEHPDYGCSKRYRLIPDEEIPIYETVVVEKAA